MSFKSPLDREHKPRRTTKSMAQTRRELFLKSQRAAQRDLTEHARKLALKNVSEKRVASEHFEDEEKIPVGAAEEMEDVADINPEETRKREMLKARKKRYQYASQIMAFDWMTDIPEDLHENWFITPRPEGKRCTVTTFGGKTVSRTRNGGVLHRFPSALPGGSRETIDKSEYCIIDCIFHEPNKTYYVLDIMCWNSLLLYDSDTECRLFWVHSRLSETTISVISDYNRYRFAPVPMVACTPENIQTAYQGENDYIQDGLLFSNKKAHYIMGLSPLHLVWKDSKCSRYFIDTNDGQTISKRQKIALLVHDDLSVRTLDGLVLGTMPKAFCEEKGIEPNQILQLSIEGIDTSKPNAAVTDLLFLKQCSPSRVLPEMWSKILFQHSARHGTGITIEQIYNSVQKSKEEQKDNAGLP